MMGEDKMGQDGIGQYGTGEEEPLLAPISPLAVLLGGFPAGTNCHQSDEEEDAARGEDDVEGAPAWGR